ncbi:hypothetical protein [Cryobacterium sp. Hh7]|uniref:hypothetical protein n=1 Tax=Cryobacterium sp. Hh7 TaxID=1259159 RepID=UPI00141BAE0C|nr:hypothetical protein [Cryobacterium sp. Hh7]
MTATHWLLVLFTIGLLMVALGIVTNPMLILYGLAFMVTPLAIGCMAAIERLK